MQGYADHFRQVYLKKVSSTEELPAPSGIEATTTAGANKSSKGSSPFKRLRNNIKMRQHHHSPKRRQQSGGSAANNSSSLKVDTDMQEEKCACMWFKKDVDKSRNSTEWIVRNSMEWILWNMIVYDRIGLPTGWLFRRMALVFSFYMALTILCTVSARYVLNVQQVLCIYIFSYSL